ncbi:GAP family protein [Paenibacillus tundrae]|uniref:Cytochrome c biogenesis protein CcdA n=1 Tax=Paenibacillus tundrae TaxID=528187 RepID=A0ABT9WDM4_9BACL|nr:GAP family protein [Paenibacillus tundrae]MDQ0171356.1 cytochrome c biogenesis protein CcdA [Paenibacillus tundrae]
MSTELLWFIGGLSLLDTLSPATLGVTVYLILTEKNKLGSRLIIYLFTIVGCYFGAGVAIKLGFGFLFDMFSSFIQNRVVSWIIFSIGGILFVWSFYVPKKKQTSGVLMKGRTKSSMVMLGVTTTIVEIGTALPYFTAIALMTNSALVWYEWIPILLAYNIIMILLPILLYALYIWLETRMRKPLEYLHRYFSKSSSSVVSWVMCIVGLVLIFYSVDYL